MSGREMDERLTAVRSVLERKGADAALIESPVLIDRVGAGNTSMAALITDSEVIDDRDSNVLASTVTAAGRVLLAQPETTHPAAMCPEATFSPELLEALVRRKTREEIDSIRVALAANEAAFRMLEDRMIPGISDHEIRQWCERELGGRTDSPVVWDGCVGVGLAAADPGAQPTGVVAERGDVVFVDIYANQGGFVGDTTRAFAIGDPPDWAISDSEAICAALDAVEDHLVPGATASDLLPVVDECLAEAGAEPLPHHLGHGTGIVASEPPYLDRRSSDRVRAGDVIAIEPGIYRPGVGGLRIEDVYLVADSGAERLSPGNRHLRLATSAGQIIGTQGKENQE